MNEAAMDILEEQSTRHYRGRWFGFGPVQGREKVVFAVFEDTKREGHALTYESFPNLKKGTQSLARMSFAPRKHFDQFIVKEKRLEGISSADVHLLRKLQTDFEVEGRKVRTRVACVLDLVEKGDCEGHATVGFAPKPDKVSDQQLGKKRARMGLDVANAFTPIAPVDTFAWPSWWQAIFLGRTLSLIREALLYTTEFVKQK